MPASKSRIDAPGRRPSFTVNVALAFAGLTLAACGESKNPGFVAPPEEDARVHVAEDQFVIGEFTIPKDQGLPDFWFADRAVPPDLPIPPVADGPPLPPDGPALPGDGGPTPGDGGPVPVDDGVEDDARVPPGDANPNPTDANPTPADGRTPADAGPPCEPDEELCDGVDNDCDDLVDEEFRIGARCEGLGACAGGVRECLDLETGICSTEPGGSVDESVEEVCNLLDDDCDGFSDEHPDQLGEGCYSGPEGTAGVGRCRAGVRLCVGGQPSMACTGEATPNGEACDGVDNDCDGALDEGIVVDGQCGLGVCRTSSTPGSCRDGMLFACQPGAVADGDANCDGLDGDCDGRPDESYVPTAQCGVGRCAARATASRCLVGVEQPCSPAQPLAQDATCDGVDDDCNGQTDEDFRGVQRCGVGVCQVSSRPAACANGVETLCQPGPETGDDSDCDGLDDDCDGVVDESYERVGGCGVGVCALNEVRSRCVNGAETPCQPGDPFLADDPVCDGLDSDCDDEVDEDYAPIANCGVGICADRAIASACAQGVEADCLPGQPLDDTDTTCDDVDDDCDGADDEDAPVVAVNGEVRITNGAGDGTRPQSVHNGVGYAAAWADNKSGRNLIYFARFDNNGVRQGDEVQVTAVAGSNSTPAIAYNGNRYAIVWQGTSGARPTIFMTLLSANGTAVAGATDVVINESFDAASSPRILWNGAQFLAFYQLGADVISQEIYSRRINGDGAPQGQEQNISNSVGTASTAPAIAWNPVSQQVGVTWSENEGAGNGGFNVFFVRADANGVRVGARERVTNAAGNESAPSIAWNGNEFGLVWQDTRDSQDIWFVRVGAQGTVQGQEVAIDPAALLSSAPSLVWDGANFGVAWYDRRAGGNEEIFFARVSPAGVPGTALRLTNAANTSFLPSLQYSGTEYGVFWYDNRDGNQEIYFTHGPFGCP